MTVPTQSSGATPVQSDKGEAVLVVEDEPRVRRVACTRLADLGYRVFEARDAASAMELLCKHPEIEVLFSDLVMPGEMSGLDLARRVRELYPAVHIILTSGYSAELLRGKGEDLGFHVLHKPYSLANLARLFRETLEAR